MLFRSFIDVAQSAHLPLLTAADAAAAELSLQLMLDYNSRVYQKSGTSYHRETS